MAGETTGFEQINNRPKMWMTGVGVNGDEDYLFRMNTIALDKFYPHTFIDPTDGGVLVMGNGIGTTSTGDMRTINPNRKLNLATLTWSNWTALSNVDDNVRFQYASAAMVDGWIVRSGGSRSGESGTNTAYDATKRTLWIDANTANSSWVVGPDMVQERKNHTLTVLPDRRILAMGGNLRGDVTGDVGRTTPESLDIFASSPAWQACSLIPNYDQWMRRGYHSTALLLPSGKVLVGGGEMEYNGHGTYSGTWPNGSYNTVPKRKVQLYSPRYGGLDSWESVRPTINSGVPASAYYGDSFTINYTLAENQTFGGACLISLGSTTHAFNMNQRLVSLVGAPTGSGNNIQFTIPNNPNLLPPGYYMFFIRDARATAGVPSAAKFIQIKDYEPGYPREAWLDTDPTSDLPYELSQLYMGDNIYFGDGIASYNQEATVVFQAVAPSSSVTKMRVRFEARTAQSNSQTLATTTATVSLWNYSTNSYVSIGTASVSAEGVYEVTSGTISSPNPYLNNNNLAKAKITFSSTTSSFDLYCDSAELGFK